MHEAVPNPHLRCADGSQPLGQRALVRSALRCRARDRRRHGRRFHHTVYLVGDDTLIGLHQHTMLAPDERFSEFRVGLDHVAFGCADRAELKKWALRLEELGIEHGEIKDAHYGSAVSFRDPDGIALEFSPHPVEGSAKYAGEGDGLSQRTRALEGL